jgi:hypothetical protein
LTREVLENSGFTRSWHPWRSIEARLRNGGIELAIVEGTARLREASLGSFNTEINDVVADR